MTVYEVRQFRQNNCNAPDDGHVGRNTVWNMTNKENAESFKN
jgi:hypothetical protein